RRESEKARKREGEKARRREGGSSSGSRLLACSFLALTPYVLLVRLRNRIQERRGIEAHRVGRGQPGLLGGLGARLERLFLAQVIGIERDADHLRRAHH